MVANYPMALKLIVAHGGSGRVKRLLIVLVLIAIATTACSDGLTRPLIADTYFYWYEWDYQKQFGRRNLEHAAGWLLRFRHVSRQLPVSAYRV